MLISRRVMGGGGYMRLFAGASIHIVGYLSRTSHCLDKVRGRTPMSNSVGFIT